MIVTMLRRMSGKRKRGRGGRIKKKEKRSRNRSNKKAGGGGRKERGEMKIITKIFVTEKSRLFIVADTGNNRTQDDMPRGLL